MSEETYPQWQPTLERYTTLSEFQKFVSQMLEDWGGDSYIDLPTGFEITYETQN